VSSVDHFQIVSVGFITLPCILALGLFIFPWPKRASFRAATSIAAAWLAAIIYTIFLYNPAGIAASVEQGVHFPQARYDNNTIACTILVGWLYPALAILGFSLLRRVWLMLRKARIGHSVSEL